MLNISCDAWVCTMRNKWCSQSATRLRYSSVLCMIHNTRSQGRTRAPYLPYTHSHTLTYTHSHTYTHSRTVHTLTHTLSQCVIHLPCTCLTLHLTASCNSQQSSIYLINTFHGGARAEPSMGHASCKSRLTTMTMTTMTTRPP